MINLPKRWTVNIETSGFIHNYSALPLIFWASYQGPVEEGLEKSLLQLLRFAVAITPDPFQQLLKCLKNNKYNYSMA